MKLEITGKDGSLTKFRITGGAAHKDDAPSIGRMYFTDGSDLTGAASKAGISQISEWVKKSETQNKTRPVEKSARTGARRIVLARNATGLNTGRPWVADGRTIDANSLNPEWEGELVCYAYYE